MFLKAWLNSCSKVKFWVTTRWNAFITKYQVQVEKFEWKIWTFEIVLSVDLQACVGSKCLLWDKLPIILYPMYILYLIMHLHINSKTGLYKAFWKGVQKEKGRGKGRGKRRWRCPSHFHVQCRWYAKKKVLPSKRGVQSSPPPLPLWMSLLQLYRCVLYQGV